MFHTTMQACLVKHTTAHGTGAHLGRTIAAGVLGLLPLAIARPIYTSAAWLQSLEAVIAFGAVLIMSYPLATPALVWSVVSAASGPGTAPRLSFCSRNGLTGCCP